MLVLYGLPSFSPHALPSYAALAVGVVATNVTSGEFAPVFEDFRLQPWPLKGPGHPMKEPGHPAAAPNGN